MFAHHTTNVSFLSKKKKKQKKTKKKRFCIIYLYL